MKTFNVTVSRTDYFRVTVEAENEEDAKDAGTKIICESADPWGCYGHDSTGFETESASWEH